MRSQAAAFKSRRVILAALRQDEVKRLGLDARYPDPVDWIETQIKTEAPDGSEFLTVMLNASDPTDAMTVLKNLTNSYMDEVVYAEQTAKAARLADVEKIYTDTGSNLNRKRENFKQDAERIGIAIGSADHDYLTFQQKTLLENLHDAKMERNRRQHGAGQGPGGAGGARPSASRRCRSWTSTTPGGGAVADRPDRRAETGAPDGPEGAGQEHPGQDGRRPQPDAAPGPVPHQGGGGGGRKAARRGEGSDEDPPERDRAARIRPRQGAAGQRRRQADEEPERPGRGHQGHGGQGGKDRRLEQRPGSAAGGDRPAEQDAGRDRRREGTS